MVRSVVNYGKIVPKFLNAIVGLKFSKEDDVHRGWRFFVATGSL